MWTILTARFILTMTAHFIKSTNVEEVKHLWARRPTTVAWPVEVSSLHGREEKSSDSNDCKRQLLSRKHFQDARLPKPCWSRKGFFHTLCSQWSSFTLLLLLHCSVGKVYITLRRGCANLPSKKKPLPGSRLLPQYFLQRVLLSINPSPASQISTDFFFKCNLFFVFHLHTETHKYTCTSTQTGGGIDVKMWLNRREDNGKTTMRKKENPLSCQPISHETR